MSSKTVTTDLKAGVLHNNEWVNMWKDQRELGFHQPVHDKILDKQNSAMFEGRTKSIFAPLCGKSLDLKWMYDKGHTVCGVEIAEQAIQEFFEEHSIEFDVQELDNIGKVYKSKDGRMNLYAADLYDVKVDVVGQFDIIYDCKSLVAINVEDHTLYRDSMLSLMKKDGKYYLNTIEFDDNVWPGPPHSTNDKLVRDLYGDSCKIDMIDEGVSKMPNEKQVEEPKGFDDAIKRSSFIAFRWYYMTFK